MLSEEEKAIFKRTELLVGEGVMNALCEVRVIIFGIGGVGSWCAEGLVRSGIKHLTIVDFDVVCPSNLNRQLMATSETIGEVKVKALRERLLSINPEARIEAVEKTYTAENSSEFDLGAYDYIIDAVDSLKDKADLIVKATATKATFFSSMGAALKIDPMRVQVADFWAVDGCPLGAALRKRLRQMKTLPSHGFLCVYDSEVRTNLGTSEVRTNGTTCYITAIFGMTLAGLVVEDIYKRHTDDRAGD